MARHGFGITCANTGIWFDDNNFKYGPNCTGTRHILMKIAGRGTMPRARIVNKTNVVVVWAVNMGRGFGGI